MSDLTSPTAIKWKAFLFLVIGVVSTGLLIVENPSPRHTMLLLFAIWAFCRAYYFAFYVIEHYVDPAFKFSGLGAFFVYLCRRPKTSGRAPDRRK